MDASVQIDMDNESETVMTQTGDLTLSCSRAMCDIMSPMPCRVVCDSVATHWKYFIH